MKDRGGMRQYFLRVCFNRNLFSSEGDSDVKTKMVEFMNTCLPDVSGRSDLHVVCCGSPFSLLLVPFSVVSSSFDDQTKANTAINKAANTAINKAVSTAESVADTDTSSEDRRVVKPTRKHLIDSILKGLKSLF